MAIEIIKQGQTKFTGHCYKCGCEFTYEMEDVVGDVVICPCCGNHIVHVGATRYGVVNPCSDSTKISTNDHIKKCEDCDFYKKNLAGGKTYIGDSPCQWCQNYPYRVTCYNSAVTK